MANKQESKKIYQSKTAWVAAFVIVLSLLQHFGIGVDPNQATNIVNALIGAGLLSLRVADKPIQ